MRDGLLERETELARAGELLTKAREGHGGVLVVEGPAGIGKTSVLQQACQRAADFGFLVLGARGSELERASPHGVVRQLFENELRAPTSGDRAALLAGAAGLAAQIVGPTSSAAGAVADVFAVNHGLYWLAANLTERAPLMLAVDDAQWADVPSLRFLAHLARRIEGMELLLAVCIRLGETDEADDSLSQLVSEPVTVVLRPAPLSVAAVARIVARGLGEEPDHEFASACHRATGGAPFLMNELVSALEADGVRPDRDSIAHVVELGPRTVARAVLRRIGRAPGAAVQLARAVAVLGADAQLHRAAQLAGIDRAVAVDAADALTGMQILTPGRPLEFVHPIVRSAIYEDLRPAARADAHLRAAELLGAEGAEDDAIAAHLLLTEPEGRRDTVRVLRGAAAQAMSRGAAESAATYLQRALEEGGFGSAERAGILFELGRAKRLAVPLAAIGHFREARMLADDPVHRARIAYELVDTLVLTDPSWDEAAGIIEASLEEMASEDPELAVRLESLRAASEFYDARLLGGLFERLPRLRELAGAQSPARRAVALQLANLSAWLGEPPEEVHRLLELGLAGGHSPAEESPESLIINATIQSFALIEDFDRAFQVADQALSICRSRGSLVGMSIVYSSRGWAHARKGDLVSAEADTRDVFKLLDELLFEAGVAGALFHAIDPLIERTELEDEARRVMGIEIDLDPNSLFWSLGLEARGRVRLAFGDTRRGIEDLNGVEQSLYAHNNPNGWGWRPALALAIADQDRDRAFDLLGAYLDRAQEIGIPRAIGIGLRTLGLLVGGEDGLAHLRHAVEVLETSQARLELARALVEYGAAFRRAGQRSAAQEVLRSGLELAHRCGANRLEERAYLELRATGARPRRAMLTGRDALTVTEQRIAAMAAEGMSNPQIAQALFVTRKNVENHLGRIYLKLGIKSRERLPDALAGDGA